VKLAAFGLVELAGNEVHDHAGPTGAVLARADERISLRRTRTERSLERAMAIAASVEASFGPWIAVDAPPATSPADGRRELERLAGTRTFADVEALLGRLEGDAALQRDLQRSLWARLRLHPEEMAAVGRRLQTLKTDSVAAHTLLGALIQAGTPEAQRTLVGEAQRVHGERSAMASIVSGLGGIEAPTMDTEAFLRTLHDDPTKSDGLGHTAEVALGNVAAHVHDADPARADAIIDDLATRLQTEKDPGEAAAELAALGNARSDRVTELAPAFLHNDDAQVRRMALFALGRVGTDAARALIDQVAESDPDPSIRRAAASMRGS
jgi:hypothetical protein